MPDRLAQHELDRTIEAVKRHGGNRSKAARELGLPVTTIKHRLQRAAQRGTHVPPPEPGPGVPLAQRPQVEALGRLASLLEKSGIPLEEIGRVEKIRLNEWDGFSKNEAGEPVVTRLQGESIVLTPKWSEGPAWPVVERAPVTIVNGPKPITYRHQGPKRAIIWPDVQIGYYLRDGALEPTHDEQALAVALEVTRDADPDVVVMVGDNLDFPELGRYRQHPAFARTTQAAIDRAARMLASIRARVRPDCRLVWLAGNHEERLPNYLIDNATAAFGLKRANAPKSWPVLSVPFLCRFEEHGAEFLPGYPANVYAINRNLVVIHGNKVRTGGSTAHAYLPELRHSVVYGHVHRQEFAAVTRWTVDGPRTYEAMSFGCLCRVDGAVPGAASGYDLDGVPLRTCENWQQGLGVIEYEEGEGSYWCESVRIWEGNARWRGREYAAPAGNEEAA